MYRYATTIPLSSPSPALHIFTHTRSLTVLLSWSVFRNGDIEGPVTLMMQKTLLVTKDQTGNQDAKKTRTLKLVRGVRGGGAVGLEGGGRRGREGRERRRVVFRRKRFGRRERDVVVGMGCEGSSWLISYLGSGEMLK